MRVSNMGQVREMMTYIVRKNRALCFEWLGELFGLGNDVYPRGLMRERIPPLLPQRMVSPAFTVHFLFAREQERQGFQLMRI